MFRLMLLTDRGTSRNSHVYSDMYRQIPQTAADLIVRSYKFRACLLLVNEVNIDSVGNSENERLEIRFTRRLAEEKPRTVGSNFKTLRTGKPEVHLYNEVSRIWQLHF